LGIHQGSSYRQINNGTPRQDITRLLPELPVIARSSIECLNRCPATFQVKPSIPPQCKSDCDENTGMDTVDERLKSIIPGEEPEPEEGAQQSEERDACTDLHLGLCIAFSGEHFLFLLLYSDPASCQHFPNAAFLNTRSPVIGIAIDAFPFGQIRLPG
jgi:hypothetical protein